jgi:hypothetical protein
MGVIVPPATPVEPDVVLLPVVVVVAAALAPPAPDAVLLKVLGDELPPPQAASSDPAIAPTRAHFHTAPNGESRIEFMQTLLARCARSSDKSNSQRCRPSRED